MFSIGKEIAVHEWLLFEQWLDSLGSVETYLLNWRDGVQNSMQTPQIGARPHLCPAKEVNARPRVLAQHTVRANCLLKPVFKETLASMS